MLRSLVGSEMCIRDSVVAGLDPAAVALLFDTLGVVRFTADVFVLAAGLALAPVATTS